MARYTGSIVKQSRREEHALHPKAYKHLVKRTTMPGQHGERARRNNSQYNIQLREKQKVKRLYGLLEKQFSKLVSEASRSKGQSGNKLMEYLERRADNAIYRGGFAVSRAAARQLVTHGHFELNGKRIDVPSMRVNAGDILKLRTKSKANGYFANLADISPAADIPAWLIADRKSHQISIKSLPTRSEAEQDINEQLIIEFYSR